MSLPTAPVLVIGGSGVVGSQAVRMLRDRYPELPLAIGGRDLRRAERLAAEVGQAAAVVIDLTRPDLGLGKGAAFSAIALFVKDHTLNSMHYALYHKIPYVSISTGTFEIGPEVGLFIHQPDSAPILMASQWLAGAAVFPVLQTAAAYETIKSIRIGVVLDEQDMGGPAASDDYERLTSVAPAALTIKDGGASWVTGEEAKGTIKSIDGTELDAQAYSPFDVISLGAATGASSIRFDLAYGMSASRRRGESYSTETVIDLTGTRKDGREGSSHVEIVHPQGQAPLTALGVSLGLERLLGLRGEAPSPGLYFPELLIEPEYFVEQMKVIGTHFDVAEEGIR